MSDQQLVSQDAALAIRQRWESTLVPELARFLEERERNAFVGVFFAAANSNPNILKCTQTSLLNCVRNAAIVNLHPNTAEQLCWLIPRKVEGVLTCFLEIGYKGYAHLIYRDGGAKLIQAGVVHEGDVFEYSQGSGGFVRHVRSLEEGRADKPISAAWALFTLADGSQAVEIMDRDDLKQIHAAMLRQNQGKETPAWRFFGDEMRKKAVVKRGIKLLPKCPTVAKALEIEHESKTALPEPQRAVPALRFGPVHGDAPVNVPEIPEDDAPIDGEFTWEGDKP